MKTYLRAFCIGLALLLALLPLQATFAQDGEQQIRITQVDASRFPQVTVYVSATDASGEPLAVDPENIQISENGQLMQSEHISGSGEIGPLTTLLVMDVSGSMYDGGKLTAAKAAAQTYVEQMRPTDQAGLLTFNTVVTYLQTITSDHTVLIQAINSLHPRGDTSMFDALYQATQILRDIPGRKAIIVLTDGLDNRSKQTADEVIQAIGAGGLSISTVGLGDPDKLGINSGLDEATLQSLAERAGGVYGYANNPETLRKVYERYGRALQSEYQITYTSPLKLRDGLSRALTVSLGETVSTQAQYNPGGVLPEVPNSVSWTVFTVVLVGLVALLFIPGLVSHLLAQKTARGGQGTARKQKSRIKLK